MMRKPYVLHPGHILSKNDGQEHYIGAVQLAACWGVPLNMCEVDPPPHPRAPLFEPARTWPEGSIHLWPDYHGNYTLPPHQRPEALTDA